jgi:hypothetical protein
VTPAPGPTPAVRLARLLLAALLGAAGQATLSAGPAARVVTGPPIVLPADCPSPVLAHLPPPAVALGPAGFAASAIPPTVVASAPAPRIQTEAERAAREKAILRVLNGARE